MNRPGIASFLFLSGTLLLAASLPLSVFGMSLAQFLLLAGWLTGGDIAGRIRRTCRRPEAALLMGLYLLHLAGLFYSTDFDYAFRDLRIKLPLLVMPVLFYTAPADLRKHADLVLGVMITAVGVSTLISFGVLHDWLPHQKPIRDIRDISIFISHIRLSLLVCFSVFLLARYAARSSGWRRLGCLAAMTWFLYFLYVLEAMTGVVIFGIVSAVLALRYARRHRRWLPYVLVMLVAVPVLIAAYLHQEALKVHRPVTVNAADLPALTANGRPYRHDTSRVEQENGHLVWIYVCEPELATGWNRRSEIDYGGRDRMGHELKYTLIRYLASKGLTRDSAGLAALGPGDIEAVEDGIANADYRELGDLQLRIRKSIKEYYLYRAGGNPTGSSLMQRLEYWRTGIGLFKKHWGVGVGTGDVQQAFNDAYRQNHTRLDVSQWHRAHNQFLTFGITFGIFGLLYFIWVLAYPAIRHRHAYAYIVFWWIAALSMLTEDTLETQAGVTFFTFLTCFLLFHGPADSPPARAE